MFATAIIVATIVVAGCGSKSDTSKGSGSDSSTGAMHSGDSGNMGGATGHHAADAHAAGGHTHTTRIEFSSEPVALPVGSKATWSIRVLDAASGTPVKEFDTVHEKILHLIVVKSDLSWFNHIHPVYKGDGLFTISTVLPKEGSYKLYADYTPKGKEQEVAQHEFATGGNPPNPVSVLPVVDGIGDGGWMLKNVTSAPEGEPGASGGTPYVVAMMPMPGRLVAGKEAMLHFQIRDAGGKPLPSLERYLGAGGHAVILSSDLKGYLHAHPMEGNEHEGNTMGHTEMGHTEMGHTEMDHTGMDHKEMDHKEMDHGNSAHATSAPGSDVVFHTTFPSAGLYKVWGQFQHRGKIITAAYVVLVEAAS